MSSLGATTNRIIERYGLPVPEDYPKGDGPIASPPPIPEITPAPSIDPAAVDPASAQPTPSAGHSLAQSPVRPRGRTPSVQVTRSGRRAQSPVVPPRRPVTPRQGGGPATAEPGRTPLRAAPSVARR